MFAAQLAVAQDRIVVDAKTPAQSFDLSGKAAQISVPVDGSVDLGAFVVETPDGPVGVDEIVAKTAGDFLEVRFDEVVISTVDSAPPEPYCVTVFHVTVCAPAARIVLDDRTEPQSFDLEWAGLSVPLDGSVDLTAFTVETPEGPVSLDVLAKGAQDAGVDGESVDIDHYGTIDDIPDPELKICYWILWVIVCG